MSLDYGGATYEVHGFTPADEATVRGRVVFGDQHPGFGFAMMGVDAFKAIGRAFRLDDAAIARGWDRAIKEVAQARQDWIEQSIRQTLFGGISRRVYREGLGRSAEAAEQWEEPQDLTLRVKLGGGIHATRFGERSVPVTAEFEFKARRKHAVTETPLAKLSDRAIDQVIWATLTREEITMGVEPMTPKEINARWRQLRTIFREKPPREQVQIWDAWRKPRRDRTT